MHERPDEMYRHGRAIDPIFAPDENLYMRVCADQIDLEERRVLPTAFRFPNQSVNREKYTGDPLWVLYPNFFDMGVVAFEVQQIPTPILREGGPAYEFRPVHDPLEENYGHSEVRGNRESDRTFNPRLKAPRNVKVQFRMRLGEAARIIHYPEVEESNNPG